MVRDLQEQIDVLLDRAEAGSLDVLSPDADAVTFLRILCVLTDAADGNTTAQRWRAITGVLLRLVIDSEHVCAQYEAVLGPVLLQLDRRLDLDVDPEGVGIDLRAAITALRRRGESAGSSDADLSDLRQHPLMILDSAEFQALLQSTGRGSDASGSSRVCRLLGLLDESALTVLNESLRSAGRVSTLRVFESALPDRPTDGAASADSPSTAGKQEVIVLSESDAAEGSDVFDDHASSSDDERSLALLTLALSSRKKHNIGMPPSQSKVAKLRDVELRRFQSHADLQARLEPVDGGSAAPPAAGPVTVITESSPEKPGVGEAPPPAGAVDVSSDEAMDIELIREAAGSKVLQLEARVLGWTISAHLSDDEGAVADDFQTVPAEGPVALQLFRSSTSSAASERKFSTHGYIHSKLRNRLAPERADKLVHIYFNSKNIDEDDMQRYVVDDVLDDDGGEVVDAEDVLQELIKEGIVSYRAKDIVTDDMGVISGSMSDAEQD
ncbi:hypothetical protein P43SY_008386 [Pythium insidiosum]|uniref:HAT C-terminal dimerisation domain-containing protein n=1 Tax=Pythium insidiosum TaxID=114742 RepID=A0AAD5LVR5_PYTIN|nr:hypothetical protein P43SY_008386 [Pythium insidiosum]